MRPSVLLFLLLAFLPAACTCNQPVDPDALRGVPRERLAEMREEILARHADGSALTARETAEVEALREQERRLAHAWIFGEWRERHGARLIFRDDGSVSVGARSGFYDELGVFKYISPEEPAYETTWTVTLDEAGDPVAVVAATGGVTLLYPFHRSRNSVYERSGDLLESSETGCYFTKINQ